MGAQHSPPPYPLVGLLGAARRAVGLRRLDRAVGDGASGVEAARPADADTLPSVDAVEAEP